MWGQTSISVDWRAWGFQLHRRAKGPRTLATEQMSESRRFLRKQEKRRALSDKRSILLTAGGVRFWSKKRSDVARNRAMGGQRGY